MGHPCRHDRASLASRTKCGVKDSCQGYYSNQPPSEDQHRSNYLSILGNPEIFFLFAWTNFFLWASEQTCNCQHNLPCSTLPSPQTPHTHTHTQKRNPCKQGLLWLCREPGTPGGTGLCVVEPSFPVRGGRWESQGWRRGDSVGHRAGEKALLQTARTPGEAAHKTQLDCFFAHRGS